jgi:acyl-CoA thioesterase-1
MALSFPKTVVASTLIGLSSMLCARAEPIERGPAEALDVALSPECRVPAGRLYTLAPLKAVRTIEAEKRPLKVLSLGSAGATTGFGSGSTRATYSVQLEGELRKVLPAISIVVEQRELAGEITAQAVERISAMVAETEPDLVVWQVGISDALAKADLDAFTGALNEVLEWLSSHEIDVVLIEPPYSAALADDEHYKGLLAAIQKSARENRVPLVLRFEAMEFLGQQARSGVPTNPFRLSHMGARCIAEHVARTVAVSVLQPDAANDAKP